MVRVPNLSGVSFDETVAYARKGNDIELRIPCLLELRPQASNVLAKRVYLEHLLTAPDQVMEVRLAGNLGVIAGKII